jgi:hypothetical protein
MTYLRNEKIGRGTNLGRVSLDQGWPKCGPVSNLAIYDKFM